MKKSILTVLSIAITAVALAQGPGHQRTHIVNHPRVNEVNSRIDRQEHRINTERREGDISRGQARRDRSNLRAMNQEKHAMRREDGGHLTRADQRALNGQLNHNSRRIGN